MWTDTTLYVLAGGQGRRLGGVSKAALRSGGERLIDRVLAMRLAFAGAYLVGDPRLPGPPPAPVLVDLISDRGLPAALWTALAHCSTEWACVLACDLPHVSMHALTRLAEARDASCQAVAPLVDDLRQPQHAFYRAAACIDAAKTIATGEGGALEILKLLTVIEVDLGEHGDSVRGINTPEDLDALP